MSPKERGCSAGLARMRHMLGCEKQAHTHGQSLLCREHTSPLKCVLSAGEYFSSLKFMFMPKNVYKNVLQERLVYKNVYFLEILSNTLWPLQNNNHVPRLALLLRAESLFR